MQEKYYGAAPWADYFGAVFPAIKSALVRGMYFLSDLDFSAVAS